MQRAAEHRLRLVSLGRDHGFQRMIRRNVNIPPHEIDKVSALQKHLGQPGVVVVLFET